MKFIGIILIVIGIAWGIKAYNMEITIETGGEIIGSGKFSTYIPKQEIYNIGLLDERRTQLMLAGFAVLSGIILYCFGTFSANLNLIETDTKTYSFNVNFWLALIVGVLVALGINYEIAWDVLMGTVLPGMETLWEVAEETLDSFYMLVGFSAAFAPMATNFTGFALFLGLLYLISRKTIKFYSNFQRDKMK